MPRDYPTPLIMWTWQDDQVEDHHLLDEAIADIAEHGFSGALAMLRGCRYSLSDPLVIDAARHAAASAHRRQLAFWFALDPRLDQGRLIGLPAGRASFLLTGRAGDDALPCETDVDADGRYRVRLDTGPPRGQHMLSQVAVTFEPAAIEVVVAYRKTAEGAIVTDSVRDISADARLFVQRGAGYFEIFGQLEPAPGPGWSVLALARGSSTYPDLGSEAVLDAISDLYATYGHAAVELDGVFWDEIGHLTSFGHDRSRLPWTPAVRRAFAERLAGEPTEALPLLLLDDDAERAGRARRDYYAAVQDVVIAAQARCRDVAHKVWGDGVDIGIHQTWHQNADDLPHGTGDWWRGSQALTGGFTDVGDAERVGEAEHLDEVLAMVVIAASLARHHESPRAFCNVWGVDYGAQIVDWWAHLLGAFGVTWLAHTYGPTSYIDCETGWGPGYPHHPTWDHCAAANAAAALIGEITGRTLPAADVAVVYPIGALARVGNAAANGLARDAQRVIAQLVRHGVAVDVISPDLFAGGAVDDGVFWLTTPHGRLRYRAVVYPHPLALQPAELDRVGELRGAGVPTVLVGERPREGPGAAAPDDPAPSPISTAQFDTAVADLPRLVEAPANAVANLFRRPDATTTVLVTPVVPGTSVAGRIRAPGIDVEVSDLSGIAAVRFDEQGRVLDHWSRDGTISIGIGTGACP